MFLCAEFSFANPPQNEVQEGALEENQENQNNSRHVSFRQGIEIFKNAYPDLLFEYKYERRLRDWAIDVTFPKKTRTFYWANGSMLPERELSQKENYWPLLYHYERELSDPADYTEEEIERVKNFSSRDNRRNGAGTPMFFFDALYDSSTRGSLEQHLKVTTFLGKKTTIHERIAEPLLRVEKKVLSLSESDDEVKRFVEGIKSTEAYYWRIIEGTNRKSFHSLGIAIDILPKSLGGKAIFWSWTRDKYPTTWMLTPLSARWMPPLSVIEIFEDEGFIWGGKWIIFDNMHFEYHPELIAFSRGD